WTQRQSLWRQWRQTQSLLNNPFNLTKLFQQRRALPCAVFILVTKSQNGMAWDVDCFSSGYLSTFHRYSLYRKFSMTQHDLHEANRLSWNAATDANNSHKQDQAEFFRAGGSTLYPEEVELLGDVRGKTLVHLQCNAGQDTLSLARLGAVVTGVDISD